MEATAIFAATGLALYAGHHVGDYWVQTDHQAQHKGAAGHEGMMACLKHVLSYMTTQFVCLALLILAAGMDTHPVGVFLAFLVSGATHYAADRREYGLMFKLARLIPGKARFLALGMPRSGARDVLHRHTHFEETRTHYRVAFDDNPSLGTGAWALDQSWHIALGVFVPALIVAAFA